MSSNHKLIALLVLGGMYFGGQGVKDYIADRSSHEEKIELTHLYKNVMEHDERQQELLAKSIQQSSDAAKSRSSRSWL